MSRTLSTIGVLAAFLLAAGCGKSGGDSAAPPVANTSTAPAATTGAASAQQTDCRIDATTAAGILGVASVRPYPYEGHQKMSPGNMDLLACGYTEASPDPLAAGLSFSTFTPKPQDLAVVYESHRTQRTSNMQPFAPGLGEDSAGWVSDNPSNGKFDCLVVFHNATNIFEVRAHRLANPDAAKSAALKAAAILLKQ